MVRQITMEMKNKQVIQVCPNKPNKSITIIQGKLMSLKKVTHKTSIGEYSGIASDFAQKFVDQATEDLGLLKGIVREGGAKLGDMLSEIQV